MPRKTILINTLPGGKKRDFMDGTISNDNDPRNMSGRTSSGDWSRNLATSPKRIAVEFH